MLTPPPLPLPIVSWIIQYGITCLLIAFFIRVFASWFGLDERVPFIRFLARLTDPFLEPSRRLVGRVGMLDLSYFVAPFFLLILRILLLQSLPYGW
jgi:YggT family protein